MNFVGKVVARIAAQTLGVARENQAVQHERVHREQRTLFDHPAINLRVAIADPALAIGTHSGETVIVATTPNGIGIEKPKRRRISSSGEVHVEVWLFRAQFADQMDSGVKVAVELTSFDDLVCVARDVKLKLIHSVFLDHFYAGVAEITIVFRS